MKLFNQKLVCKQEVTIILFVYGGKWIKQKLNMTQFQFLIRFTLGKNGFLIIKAVLSDVGMEIMIMW